MITDLNLNLSERSAIEVSAGSNGDNGGPTGLLLLFKDDSSLGDLGHFGLSYNNSVEKGSDLGEVEAHI